MSTDLCALPGKLVVGRYTKKNNSVFCFVALVYLKH